MAFGLVGWGCNVLWCRQNPCQSKFWRVGAVNVASEEGSNLFSSKEVSMAVWPQPTSQSSSPTRKCLEKEGPLARVDMVPLHPKIPQASYLTGKARASVILWLRIRQGELTKGEF